MFRTGHRTDPMPSTDIPAPSETVEPEPHAVVTAPPIERSAARASGRSEAVLGQGVTFDGTLRFTGSLRIDGTFKGHILAGDALVIGETAEVNADVTCVTIDITGAAQGSLTATRSVELHAAARVAADVTTPSLKMAEGAVLDGTLRMRGAPARAARRDRPKPVAEDS
jgi:cytoskeletal protein CcmA (bactofilin family)